MWNHLGGKFTGGQLTPILSPKYFDDFTSKTPPFTSGVSQPLVPCGPLWSLWSSSPEGGVKEALLSQTGQCSRIEEKWSSQLQALQVFQLKSSGRFLLVDPMTQESSDIDEDI